MKAEREFECVEFDWFATDIDGRFALFATAGEGPIPEEVARSAAAHDAIGESIPITGWGSSAVWQSYAKVGLFAYDWSSTQGNYVQVAVPARSVLPDLRARLQNCAVLPALNASFAETSAINPRWQSVT